MVVLSSAEIQRRNACTQQHIHIETKPRITRRKIHAVHGLRVYSAATAASTINHKREKAQCPTFSDQCLNQTVTGKYNKTYKFQRIFYCCDDIYTNISICI